jgi:excisionase family DNA binding protein
MLMHEWLRHRDRHAGREAPPEEPAAEPESLAATAEGPPEPEAPLPASRPEMAELEAELAAETAEAPSLPAARPSFTRLPAAPGDLHAPEGQTRRLQRLVGRQQRLPLEVEEAQAPARGSAACESREELIERLLDPVLSIEETSTLLGVCATSVRRYTNRGVLKCFRTPGNQRRFRLSDVLDFMEKQQSTSQD